jgi:hypothetical protein
VNDSQFQLRRIEKEACSSAADAEKEEWECQRFIRFTSIQCLGQALFKKVGVAASDM